MNAEKPSVTQNVDHAEIAKFEAVASRWWDTEGEFKPLHRINRCASAISPNMLAACLANACWMSAAAAVFSPRAWPKRVRR